MLQTEFPFQLPLGYVDAEGNRHRDGTMRLATAYDEIAPLKDPRVQSNPGYLLVILLSRVVVRLGTLDHINPEDDRGIVRGRSRVSARHVSARERARAGSGSRAVPALRQAFVLELSAAGGFGATP